MLFHFFSLKGGHTFVVMEEMHILDDLETLGINTSFRSGVHYGWGEELGSDPVMGQVHS